MENEGKFKIKTQKKTEKAAKTDSKTHEKKKRTEGSKIDQ
jgi:hypothetical protein